MKRASFYLYFPEESDARTASERLGARGFETDEVVLSTDDVNWLALVHKDIDPDQLHVFEAEMGELADDLRGEYDGHEIDV